MNTINGMTFYDALTKFIIGFLITFLWLPEIINCGSAYCSCGVSLNAVQTFLYGILCFIAGFVWEAVYNLCGYVCKKIVQHFKKSNEKECNPRNTIKLYLHDLFIFLFYNTRNNEEWIKRARFKVLKERRERCRRTPTNHKYYIAYYKNVNAPISSVKILEAHEAFLRYVIFLLPLISPIALMVRRIFHLKINCANFLPDLSHCVKMTYVFIGCLLMDLILFYVWRKIQFKIHELVWEAKYYKE